MEIETTMDKTKAQIDYLTDNQLKMYNYCNSKVKNSDVASAYLSDFNEKVLTMIYKGDMDDKMLDERWFRTTMRDLMIDAHRAAETVKKRAKKADANPDKIVEPDGAESISAHVSVREILQLCKTLNEEEEQILLYRFYTGKTYIELSVILNVGDVALRARYFRAIKKLQSSITFEQIDELFNKNKTTKLLKSPTVDAMSKLASILKVMGKTILTAN